MYLIRGIRNIELYRAKFSEVSTVATIGNFDGLHLGHQQILNTMQKKAESDSLKKLIIFTEPHAQEFFVEAAGLEATKPPRIFPWQEKVRKMKEHGVEFSFFLKFNNGSLDVTDIFVFKVSFETEDILGSASPRKPIVAILCKSISLTTPLETLKHLCS